MNNATDLLRYVVRPSTSTEGWWMAVDTKTHHALAFCKTKEEAQAFCDKRNDSEGVPPVVTQERANRAHANRRVNRR